MPSTHRYRRDAGRPVAKPGTFLKAKVPVRTFADWEDVGPGYMELDLVAHCGETTAGEYLHTLNAVDVATSWCEPRAILNRSQHAVTAAIDRIQERLPFPLRGIDSDNDSAFLNAHLSRYCREEEIEFTRSRPYTKNDQAHVEGRNWSVVRQLVGYRRYESQAALDLLEAIYADWRLVVNYFQPVRKLSVKEREGDVRPGSDAVPAGARLPRHSRGQEGGGRGDVQEAEPGGAEATDRGEPTGPGEVAAVTCVLGHRSRLR